MKRVQTAAAALTALALTAALAVPVWAADASPKTVESVETGSNTAEIAVTAVYNPETVYHVDISWGSMAFEYNPGEWTAESGDEDKLAYTGKNVGWNNGDNDNNFIKIVNKSNENVCVTPSFTEETDYSNIKCYFYDNSSTEIETSKGIWMQRADANIDGVTKEANTTSQDHNRSYITTGKAPVANLKLYLTGRPNKKTGENGTTIGTVTLTLTSADDNPTEGFYSKTYDQSTAETN